VFRELSNTKQTQDGNLLRRGSPEFYKPAKQRLTPDERKRIDYDIITLKRSLNICREENTRLKERMNKVKEELKSKKLHVKELNHNMHNLQTMNKRILMTTYIDPKIRQYIAKLEKEIKALQKERNALTQYTKETKYKEIQIELKNSLEECKRLRNMIEIVSSGKLKYEGNINVHKLALENKQLLKRLEQGKTTQLKKGFKMRFKHTSKNKDKVEKEFKKTKQNLHSRIYIHLL
jgi:chromosome segregation ATPase